ncbi:gustatory receptor for sugar taste 61a [Drosophila nasuta]|uniref:gustatory receptor for sugar taste 61a n=1 Tax=Drosophila nasuta TaxID=42062 RepID=UPI00295EAC74|nr:gustatory receptor for sugar taste 61a [Drosophila nasuta]
MNGQRKNTFWLCCSLVNMRKAASTEFFQPNFNILRQLRLKRRQQRALAAHKVRCKDNAKDLEELDTFHRAIRPYLCLARIFGMMPLANVMSPHAKEVKFHLRSTGMCFSAVFLLLGGIKTMRIAAKIYQGGINSRSLVSLVFYIMGLIICLNFISFARCWHRLIVPWNEIDIIMLFPPYSPTKISLRVKLFITGCVFGCLTLIEHGLYYASAYTNYHMHMLHCQPNVTEILFSGYMKREFADIFEILPYNPLFIFYAFFLTGTFSFISNFLDTFIILISMALAQRFKQFSHRVLKLKNRQVPDALWHELRQHHILLCELMDLVDTNMSSIVLFSCLNNIYFICNRLLTIFTKLRYPVNYAFFWFSLLFLLGRTCAVFLYASRIHEFSELPLEVLYMVPSDNWTEEVQRFTHQINNQFIALSGYRLYYLTRKSFFGMMSTLVYYEFMLLQLDAKDQKGDLPALCA